MDNLIFSFNVVAPLVLLIAVGCVLRKLGVGDDFWNLANKLVFRLFLPVLLFCNVYSLKSVKNIDVAFVVYAVVAIIVVFLAAMAIVPLFVKENAQKGVVIQALFRSNYAIIGVPLATSLYGAEGAACASLLSAFIIPLFNVLAVVALSAYAPSEAHDMKSKRTIFAKVGKGIVTNPLIISVFAGILILLVREIFVANDIDFRLFDFSLFGTNVTFVGDVCKSLANVATPLALLVLGGKFSFSSDFSTRKTVAIVTFLRMVVLPAVALVVAHFVAPSLRGEHIAAYIAVFGSPVAVASAVMAREMGGDDKLAGKLVVWNTVASAFTLFAIIAATKALGWL